MMAITSNKQSLISETITLPVAAHFRKPKIPLRISTLPFLRFACVGNGVTDYLYGFREEFVTRARALSADFLVFANRPWREGDLRLSLSDEITVALLTIDNYEKWYSSLKKQTKQMIRKSSEEGIRTYLLDSPTQAEAEGIYQLFTESPFREGRYFEGYHLWTPERILREFKTSRYLFSVVAAYEDQIVGVSRIVFREQAAIVQTLLSSAKMRKSVRGISNALMAASVQELSQRGIRYLMYGKMGHLSGLDVFRANNGFKSVQTAYNYLPLTSRGRFFAKLGVYRPRDLLFSTRLKSVMASAESLQKYLPISVIQKFHLYL